MDDKRKTLYDALSKDGYDVGDYDSYINNLNDEAKRKSLYDAIKDVYDIGDYDSFSRNIVPDSNQRTISISPQKKEEVEQSILNIVRQTAVPEYKQEPGLQQMVDSAKKSRETKPSYTPQVQQTDVVQAPRPVIPIPMRKDTRKRDEEAEIDNTFTAMPENTEEDVYRNFYGRFSLTKRGQNLQKEMADKEAEVQKKFLDEFQKSPEYLEYANKKYASKEESETADKRINELFTEKYGDAIYKEMRPYQDAYYSAVIDRYGDQINEHTNSIVKRNAAEQLDQLQRDIDMSVLDNKRKLQGYSANDARGALQSSYNYSTDENIAKHRQDAGALEAANRLTEEAKEIVKEASKKGKTNFVAGLLRGFRDNAFDAEQWSMGVVDLADKTYLFNALQKFNRGEKLSDAEEKLLEASSVNMIVNAYYAQDIGRGYKAGQVNAQSLPFIFEFVINPISASGSTLAKGLLKYAGKAFGKDITKRSSIKMGTRFLGDLGAAAGMTLTTGAAGTLADAKQRMIDNYDYSKDSGVMRVEKTGDTGFGEALGRAALARTVENQSEMIFNTLRAGRPLLKTDIISKIPVFKKLSSSDIVKLANKWKDVPILKNIRQRSQIGGTLEEYGEEVYNNIVSIATGEADYDVLSLDNNIDTFLGLIPMQLAFSSLGVGGAAIQEARSRRKMRKLKKNMNPEDQAQFEEFRQAVEMGDYETVPRNYIRSIIEDNTKSDEEKRTMIFAVREEVMAHKAQEVKENQTEPEDVAYNEGQSGDIAGTANNLDRMEAEAMRVTGAANQEELNELLDTYERNGRGDTKAQRIADAMYNQDGRDNEAVRIMLDYLNADAKFKGASNYVMDRVDEAVEEENSKIDAITHKGGFIQSATMKNDHPVYITSGNIVTLPDGTIDREKSDQDIIVFDQTTGKLEFTTADQILEMGIQSNPEEIKAQNAEIVSQQIISESEMMMNAQVVEETQQDALSNEPETITQQENQGTLTEETNQAQEIPVDEEGEPIFTGIDPSLTIDYIYNQSGLEEQDADEFVNQKIAESAKNAAGIEKKKPKVGSKIGAYKREIAAWETERDAAQEELNYWTNIQNQIIQSRNQPKTIEQQQDIIDVVESDVPDVVNDKAVDARARGYRMVNGYRVDRPSPIRSNQGANTEIRFSTKDAVPGGFAVIEAGSLQPSHVNGQRNPYFFINEAQPKDRVDDASIKAADDIASAIRPEEITGGVTAYTGSPVVNTRGEVVQGNNRSAALRAMYNSNAEQSEIYKNYLRNHAADYGLTEDQIDEMEQPVLVRIADVSDVQAIRLGQMTAQDTESGGIERIKPVQTYNKMGDSAGSFVNILLNSEDENRSLADLVAENGVAALKYLAQKQAISDTQYQSAFDRNGNLTPEAKQDLTQIVEASLFEGGPDLLPQMFRTLPAKSQKAILSTFSRDRNSEESKQIRKDIHNAIQVFYEAMQDADFASATNYESAKRALEIWKRQINMMDGVAPMNKFDNFAIELAARFKGNTMKRTAEEFNAFYDLVQGEQDLFSESGPVSKNEAINQIYNVEYESRRENAPDVENNTGRGEERGSGSNRDGSSGELNPEGERTSDTGRGTVVTLTEAPETTNENRMEQIADRLSEIEYRLSELDEEPGMFSEAERISLNMEKSELESEYDGLRTTNAISKAIQEAEAEVDQNPTEAQKEAGNYKKGHIKIDGYDITIENPKGSERSGTDKNGTPWSITMNNTYGYIRGTESVDGDHIDVFLSDNPSEGNVFVVDQIDQETGEFDEHKVMYGFNSIEEAKDAYLSNYSEGWKIGPVTEVSKDEFKKWISSSKRKTKPFAEYKSIKEIGAQNENKGEKSESNGKSDTESNEIEKIEDVGEKENKNIQSRSHGLRKGSEGWRIEDRVSSRSKTDGQSIHTIQGQGITGKSEEYGVSGRSGMDEQVDGSSERVEQANYESKDIPLTEIEYANKRKAEILSENPEIDEDEAENMALDEYPEYISKKIESGELEKLYAESSISDRIKLGRIVETAGYEVSDISATANKLQREGKKNNSHNKGETVNIIFFDGSVVSGKITEAENGNITVKSDINGRVYTVPEENIINPKLSIGNDLSEMNSDQRVVFDTVMEMLEESGIETRVLSNQEMNELAGLAQLMTVYHGSGAQFDAFDHSHMGEGEGVQAYGWGSYVTEVEGIGRTYAEKVTGQDYTNKINRLAQHIEVRKEFIKTRKSDIRKNEDYDKYAKNIRKNLGNSQKEYKAAERAGNEKDMDFYQTLIDISNQQLNPDHHKHLIDSFWDDINNAQEDIDKANAEIVDLKKKLKRLKGKRNIYTIEIPDNTGENYLEWEGRADKIIDKVGITVEEYETNDISTGRDVYEFLNHKLGSDKAASEFLSRAGFVGISYPAQFTTGGRSDNAKNYVIFNEEDLQIKDRISFMRGKKKASETVLPEDESSFKGTVVSDADGTKVLNNLDNVAKEYDKFSKNRPWTFLGDVAKALGARQHGSKSQYATFETVNGQVVTIRLSDHNASTRNFDNAGRENGISIVISRKPNQGIINDGNAHLVEFFYPDKALQKADGKPLAEIVRSIKQTLYSGEYTDTTGLAQRQEVNIAQADDVRGGIVYGATVGGKIYLNGSALNPESPLHEYTHIWDEACRRNNPELWNRGVELMKQTPMWEEVKNDPNYSNLQTDNEIASEVHSRLTGADGAERMEQMVTDARKNGAFATAEAISLREQLKKWLSDFWWWLKDTMIPWTKEESQRISLEDFINMPLKDLANGINLNNTTDENVRFRIGETGSGILDKYERGQIVLEQYRDKEINSDNVNLALYDLFGVFAGRLYENRFLGNVLTEATINEEKAKEEYERANAYLNEYAKVLNDLKGNSTEAAKAIIDEEINDINKAVRYYKDLADGKDVWRWDSPRFRSISKLNISKQSIRFGKMLGTGITIANTVEEIENAKSREAIENGRNVKGWFEPSTGKVVLYMPNIENEADAQATILHEVVGHKGLRELFGDKFDRFLYDVFSRADKPIRQKIAQKMVEQELYGRLDIATEEYLAEMAERGFNENERGFWNMVKRLFSNLLHEARIRLGFTLRDSDLRYILWRSYQLQRERGALAEAANITMKQNLGLDEAPQEVRFRISEEQRDNEYDNALKGWRYKFQEAYQDSMLALKKLQEIISKKTGPILDSENAYMAENQLSSKNKIESEIYRYRFFNPMIDAVTSLIRKSRRSYEDILKYLIAKHGLERNRVFALRDAIEATENPEETRKKINEQISILLKEKESKKLDEKAYKKALEEMFQKLAPEYKNFRKRDYSGLKALTGEKKDFENAALQIVEEMDQFGTKDLWDAINKATKETLRKSYESGMMNRAQYDYVSNMFEYYVPLRGWSEDVASDVYEYFTTKDNSFNPTLKRAKRRTSLADDPLANIGNMAESAILQGNRNLMKQKFLNMVLNHKNKYATVKDMWYKNEGTKKKPIWKESIPDIPEDATAEKVNQILEEHEALMKELQKEGMAKKRISKLDVGYRTTKKERKEHIVRVKRNGKDYLIYINGNPRAAQAINGLTNPDSQSRFWNGVNWINRQLSANFTSRNPAFVLTNLSRDLIFAGTAVAIKEDYDYVKAYTNNIKKILFQWKTLSLIRNFDKGKIGNSPMEQYFKEFLENGGETGYTQLMSVDEFKKIIRKEINLVKEGNDKRKAGDPTSALNAATRWVETFNRSAEDMTRFAVYMTSRQMGRSIQRSVSDAKEITVNFNKKGSGALGARYFKYLYIFFNAAVQSLTNFGRLAKNNPKKFTAMIASTMAAGFIIPMANILVMAAMGDDDDKDAYFNLPEWVRRNNLVFYIPGTEGRFLTIPLPIEMRVFYGLGELFLSYAYGRETGNVGLEIMKSVSDLSPVDLTGHGGEGFISFALNLIPSFAAPLFEIAANKDYFGSPIYKDTDYNKEFPGWTKAYGGTNKTLVKMAEGLNQLTGGDKYKKGWLNINPAIVEHLFDSYFGGLGKTINQVGKSIASVWYPELRESRNYPVINRFYSKVDEKSGFRSVNERFYKYMDEFKETQKNFNGYKKDASMGAFEYAEKLSELVKTPEFKRYNIIRIFNKEMNGLKQAIKESPDMDSKSKLENLYNLEKARLVEMLDKINE